VFDPWRQYRRQLSTISLDAPDVGQRTAATIRKLASWLDTFGSYVESERAFVDGEIAKVLAGAYVVPEASFTEIGIEKPSPAR
jgi:hypothetical protein